MAEKLIALNTHPVQHPGRVAGTFFDQNGWPAVAHHLPASTKDLNYSAVQGPFSLPVPEQV